MQLCIWSGTLFCVFVGDNRKLISINLTFPQCKMLYQNTMQNYSRYYQRSKDDAAFEFRCQLGKRNGGVTSLFYTYAKMTITVYGEDVLKCPTNVISISNSKNLTRFPVLVGISSKDTIIGFYQNHCWSFIITVLVKILCTPTISRSSVTKIPITLLSQPFLKLFNKRNLFF